MPIEKILITGASGYLARFIIDRLQGTRINSRSRTSLNLSIHFLDTTFIQSRCNKSS